MVLPSPYLQSNIPPLPVYQYFCRVCMKPFKTRLAWKRHEADSHGPRMQCGQCKFSCPEGRPGEMRKHRQMKHGVVTRSPPRKRRRQSAPANLTFVQTSQSTLASPTKRIPAETLAVESYTLSSNQGEFLASLSTVDLGPDPDVSISEPVYHVPTYGPTTTSDPLFTSFNDTYLQSVSLEVPASFHNSPSSVAVHQPVSKLSTPPLTLHNTPSLGLSGRFSPELSVSSPVLSVLQSPLASAISSPLASLAEDGTGEAASPTSLIVTSSEFPSVFECLSPSQLEESHAKTVSVDRSLSTSFGSVPSSTICPISSTSSASTSLSVGGTAPVGFLGDSLSEPPTPVVSSVVYVPPVISGSLCDLQSASYSALRVAGGNVSRHYYPSHLWH